MRIRRLTARFGRIDGTVEFDPDRLNLVLDGNEQGKSTLVAAVLAALYGFPSQRGRAPGNQIKERDRYRPLTGDRFDVALELEVGGHGYRIHRDFARETVAVRDALSGEDVTARFVTGKDQYDVGRPLLGLTREQFLKTALVRQGDLQAMDGAADLTRKLEADLTTRDGDRTAAEAIAALQEALNRYDAVTAPDRVKVETEIKRLEEALARIEADVGALDAVRRGLDAELALLDRMDREAADLEAERERMHYLGTLAALHEVRSQLGRHERALADLADLRRQAEGLSPFAAIRREDYDRVLSLRTQAEGAAREIEALAQPLRETEDALARTRSELRAYAAFEGFTEDDWAEAQRARQRVDDALQHRDRTRAAVAEAREEAARRGIDLARASVLQSRFEALGPQDREFIAAYTARRYEHQREVERLEAGLGAADAGPGIGGLGAATRFLLIAGAVALVAGLGLLVVLPFAGLVAILAGAGLLVYGLLGRRRGSRGQSVEAEAALLVRRRDLEAARARLQAHEERGRALAAALGYAGPDDLTAEYAAYLDVRAEQATLREKEAAAETAAREAGARQGEAAALWRRAGRDLPPERVDAHSLDEFLASLRAYLDLRQAHAAQEDETRSIQAARARWQGELDAALAGVREIAERYGLADGSPDAAARDLAALLRKRDDLERLQTERIPARERDLLGNAQFVELAEQVERLERDVADLASRRPLLANLAPEQPAPWYHARVRELTTRVDETRRQRTALVQKAAGVLEDYKSRYPKLLAEREECMRALQRARDFRDAAALALETLERIAAESHRGWAQVLNREASRVLPALSGRYVDMRFAGDLSFVVRDRDGREWDQRAVLSQLSAGARDQIYLALRTVLARCFSAEGIAIPLILDDPFVTSDDARFRAAMRFLLDEVAPAHQVIVTSCHEARHHDLLRSDSDIAARVHLIEMDGVLGSR